MSFMTETEQNFRRPFLDVNIISKQGIFTITVTGKQTFSVVYIHFKKSLKKIYLTLAKLVCFTFY